MENETFSTACWWWPKDARSHQNRFRCGNCGHGLSFHAAGAKGRETGPCGCRNADEKPCTCRAGRPPANTKPTK